MNVMARFVKGQGVGDQRFVGSAHRPGEIAFAECDLHIISVSKLSLRKLVVAVQGSM